MTRLEMLGHIDKKAGAVRSCYITVAPGQEATYMLKAQQARDFTAAGFTGAVPSLVAAEASAVGDTTQAACTRILTEEAQWVYLAGLVEGYRRGGKVAVAAAASDELALVAHNTTISQLSSLMP